MAETVLITGARAAAALELAREFHRAGYNVHMADRAPARISGWSRSVAQLHRYPSPVRDLAGFISVIKKLVENIQPRLIIPCCEEIFHLARPELTIPGALIFMPDTALLATLHDKGRFAALCRDIGLPAPDTHFLDQPSDLAPFMARPEDWVFKPRFSRFGGEALIGPDTTTLARITPSLRKPWIAQRRIIGHELCFYAVASGGNLNAFAAYSAGWRLGGGASISFDPIDAAQEDMLLALARRLAEATSLTGQFACDVMIDTAGQPWLIECNPRATSGVHLLARDGALARAMTTQPDPAMIRTRQKPRHLLPAMMTYGLVAAVRTKRLGLWYGQLRDGHDVAGNPGDRLPAWGAMIDGIGFMLAAARRGISTTAATTVDIEWNGDALS